MLSYNPNSRPTADDLLKHPYFTDVSKSYLNNEKKIKMRKTSKDKKPKTN